MAKSVRKSQTNGLIFRESCIGKWSSIEYARHSSWRIECFARYILKHWDRERIKAHLAKLSEGEREKLRAALNSEIEKRRGK